MQTITIQKPDDWHTHLRDGDTLKETVSATARCFQRAVVMPNLVPPIINAQTAQEYRQRILAARGNESQFDPVMTIYLTDKTSVEDIQLAKKSGVIAAKLYPMGATTNSSLGVSNLDNLSPVFTEMTKQGMLLLIHGEVTGPEVDIFDREKLFIERHLAKITKNFQDLKIVFEHITTSEAVSFVKEGTENIAATITPQHLLLSRNDIFSGGIRPHNYCLPVLKRSTHRDDLRKVITSGSRRFFLGTDSAPHEQSKKESACGCAGCYSAPVAIELYTQIFDELNSLDKLEGFASHHGADFYGLPRNKGKITLVKKSWQVPEKIILPNGQPIIPFWAGQTINWSLN